MSVVRTSPIRRWLPWAAMAVIAVTVLVLGTRSDGAAP